VETIDSHAGDKIKNVNVLLPAAKTAFEKKY